MNTNKLTEEEQLKRFLYLANFDDHFISGNIEKYSFFNNTSTLIQDFVSKNPSEFLRLITIINEDKLLPRRQTLLFSLSSALNCDSKDIKPEVRHNICSTALKVSTTDEEFASFIKYYTTFTSRKTKIPTAIKKTIAEFYRNKTPMELALSFALGKCYHSWSHRDLLKLAHYKPENPLKEFVVNTILFDAKNLNAEESYEDEKQKIAEVLKGITMLRQTSDVKVATSLIPELHASFSQINPILYKHPEVWAAVIRETPVKLVLKILHKLYRMGLLKTSSCVHAVVIEMITNLENIKACNLYPVEVFIYLKTFEKGGKPKDPKLLDYLKLKLISQPTDKKEDNTSVHNDTSTHQEPKCPMVISAINRCLGLSYYNVTPTGKRIMITIDASENGKLPCLHNKNITCLEAAVAITICFLKVEKDVTIAVFNGQCIDLLPVDKGSTFTQICQKILQNTKPCQLPSPPFVWALESKKSIDFFINFIHCSTFLHAAPSTVKEKYDRNLGNLKQYRRKMNLPTTRLATVCLSSPKMHLGSKNRYVIDIAGFVPETFTVLAAFCNGSFN